MKKIKLFSIYTEETIELKDIFLRSIQDDWELNLVYWGKNGENGNWGTQSFGKLIRSKLRFIIDTIEKNWDDIIIISDIDIQFFRKCTKIIEKQIKGYDILFQSENWPEKNINAGFMVIRCNKRSLGFYKAVYDKDIEKLKFFEQSAMNEILQENKQDLRWNILPAQFWAMSHQKKPPIDIVLHHANCTAPTIRNGKRIGSIELKLEQYYMIRKYVLINNQNLQY